VIAAALLGASLLRSDVRVMSWNIWRGGHEAMDAKDPVEKAAKQDSIISVIQREDPDIVAMVETYGSGEVIAHGLKYHFQPRGTNVSIFSRWPIEKDISVYKPFNCVGAIVQHPSGQRLAVYAVWIHYEDDIWTDPKSRYGKTAADLLRTDGESRVTEVKDIIAGIAEQAGNLPVILAGDFNSNSHLDYTEAALSEYGIVAPWPVIKTVAEAGYRDSYREANPAINRAKDRTWSPRFPDQIQDRIDFIFWKGAALQPTTSRVVDRFDPVWPSDHAAVVTDFQLK
jgi:endonuclease/exonuclease/phosphatase family metal-dependent hydrolase